MYFLCLCVCVIVKLHITAQSGPAILSIAILFYSQWSSQGGINEGLCVCLLKKYLKDTAPFMFYILYSNNMQSIMYCVGYGTLY